MEAAQADQPLDDVQQGQSEDPQIDTKSQEESKLTIGQIPRIGSSAAKHKAQLISKSPKKKSKKPAKTDDTDSDESDEDTSDSDESSDESSSDEDDKQARKKKQKKKTKKKKMLKKKKQMSRSKQRREAADSSSSSDDSDDTDSDSASEEDDKRRRKGKKVRGSHRRAEESDEDLDSSDDDEEADAEAYARLQAELSELNTRCYNRRARGVNVRLGGKSHTKKKRSGKRGSTLEFKRVDQLWDSELHSYESRHSS